ncbi:MAG: NAD-dependent epimerase/dehydratase family protein [Eubacteriales bacterium]
MKVIVTGGAGFIGSHIVDTLVNKKYEVIIIDNLSNGRLENVNDKAKFYKMDIRDNGINNVFENELPDVLIHHAAQISVSNSIEDPKEDASVNIMGTLNLFEACRKYNVKKIIYPSSAAVYGEPKHLPIDEEHPLDMESGYGVSKQVIENYLKVYKKLFKIDFVIYRYSNVYGPRQDSSGEGGVISIFVENYLHNEPINVFGDGEQTRDFIYIRDVVEANVMAIENNYIGTFNLCTGQGTSINDLIYNLNKTYNKKIKVNYKKKRNGDINQSVMSNSKLFNVTNWKPNYLLREGLEDMNRFGSEGEGEKYA